VQPVASAELAITTCSKVDDVMHRIDMEHTK